MFAWNPSETADDKSVSEGPERVRQLAFVPQWMTVLVLVASTDAIATCPRRLVERHADMLGLQVIDLPFPPDRIVVSVMRRTGAADPGTDWFLDQVRAAAAG